MCGIVGYLGTEPEAITAVLDGLLLLHLFTFQMPTLWVGIF